MNNMYQAKVEQVEKYSDSQSEHLVHKGKLVFLHPPYRFKSDVNIDYGDDIICRPIIISETEKPKNGDWVFAGRHSDLKNNSIFQLQIQNDTNLEYYDKILALPEHFSDAHKMKDGDEVLVKCENWKSTYLHGHQVHLDQKNHITLFPVKQSLEDVISEYYRDELEDWVEMKYTEFNSIIREVSNKAAEWAKRNL